jgi:exo-beta-1,3-glucanase (GH17 family)
MPIVAPYTGWVRTFGCASGLEAVSRVAHEIGLPVALGAWLSHDGPANEHEIACLIQVAQAGYADVAIVGSEVLGEPNVGFERHISRMDSRTSLERVGRPRFPL